jgi:predicted ATP-dependent endonuclease of OLD family
MEEKKIWTIYVQPKYKKTTKRLFEIEDFQSIKKTNIKLDKLTILVGENASGKSSILEYFNQYSYSFFDLNNAIDKMVDKFYVHANSALLGYRSMHDEIHVKTFGINNLEITLNEGNESFSYKVPKKNIKELPIERTLKIGKFKDEENEDKESLIVKKFFRKQFAEQFSSSEEPNINSFSDLIALYKIPLDMSNMNKKNVENNISLHITRLLKIGFNLEKNQNDIYDVLSFLPHVVNNINKTIYETINLKKIDTATSIDKKISVYLTLRTTVSKSGTIKSDGFQVLIRDEAENTVFPPHLKSSGINNIITIVIILEFLKYLIEVYSDRNYKSLNYLFTIDEPELYLHPKIQKNLIKYIYETSQNIEEIHFLLATHSPYIVHPNAIESTYLLEYDFTKGTVANKLINIVKNQEDKYSILTPIEGALGLSFNEFLHPIIFVEGEEELELFRNISKIYRHTNTIHSLKGKNKFAPIAILLKKFKSSNKNFSVFLDADFDFRDDFKSVEDGQKVLEVLSQHLFFIGKEIYTFAKYRELEKKDECLEDFIIYTILNDEEYEFLIEIVKELWNEYFDLTISWDFKVKNFTSMISKIRGILSGKTKSGTSQIKDEILKKDNFKDRDKKEIFHYVETEIKDKIKNKLLATDDKYMKFEEEILKIISINL